MATKKRAAELGEQPMLDGMEPTPRELGFRGPQVCSIVGITYRQLDYWARTDLVRPSIADAKGSGTQRTYSFQDLVRLKVVKSLLDAGVKLQTARQAIDYLREDLGDDWATANLVLDGTNSVLARTDDMLIDVVRHGQGVLNIVPLGHVMEELDAGVREHVAELRAAPGRLTIRGVAAPRAGALRAQLRTTVREAARLLRDRLGVRAAHVRARARPRRQPGAGVHPRLLPARRTTSTSRSPRSTRSWSPRRTARRAGWWSCYPEVQDQGALPARLPAAAREVRARTAVAARRRRRSPATRNRSTSFPEPRPAERPGRGDPRERDATALRHSAHSTPSTARLGARMVPFGGWEMPIQYTGVLEEHRACREHAVVFDVSHLGSVHVHGAGAFATLQWAFTNDLDRIGPGARSTRTCSTPTTRTSSTTSSCGGSRRATSW